MPPSDPIAYLFTWITYGTWLPGDARGWVEFRHGFQLPNPILEQASAARMTEDACVLTLPQRQRAELQVAETCSHNAWPLHAVNCRSNHIHVVPSSPEHPTTIRKQLKAWCTRRLNEQQIALGIPEPLHRTNWWAERGSIRWIFDENDLAAAIDYVLNQQDNPRRFAY
jgi:REP element-mobilizing transposase RayT